jgi:tetratricopeptide (TPR) repeat protein
MTVLVEKPRGTKLAEQWFWNIRMSHDITGILKNIQKHLNAGKTKPAIDEALKGLKETPSDCSLMLLLGDLYLKIGNESQAIKYLQKASDQFCADGFLLKGIAVYRRIHRISPGLIEARLKLADLYSRQGMLAEARFEILAAAEEYERRGQTREIIDLFHKLIEIDPQNLQVRSELASLYDREGMSSEATSLYLAISKEYLQRKDPEQALPFLIKARDLNPQNAAVQWKMLWAYLELNDAENSRKFLQDFIATALGDLEILGLIIKTHTNADSMHKMHALINKTLETDERKEPYYILKGELYLHSGDMESAFRQFEIAIHEQREHPDLRKSTTLMHRILRLDGTFFPAWKKLIDLYESENKEGDLCSAYEALVEAYLKRGMYQDAEEWLLLLQDWQPGNALYAQKLSSLYRQGKIFKHPVQQNREKSEDFDLEIDLDGYFDSDPSFTESKEELKKPADLDASAVNSEQAAS